MLKKSKYITWREKNPKKALLKHAKRRAKKKGREFSLTEADIEIPEFCPVLGIRIEAGGLDYSNSPSIDRLDQSKGYTSTNIIVVSYLANITRNSATPNQIRRVGRFYHKLLKAQDPKKELRNMYEELTRAYKVIKDLIGMLKEESLISLEEEEILLGLL